MNKKALAVLSLITLFCLATGVAAAASGNGPDTTVLGMPVQWTFRGLSASTEFDIICVTGSNYTVVDGATSDSSGVLVVSINYFYQYGQNSYDLLRVGVCSDLQFNINNMDIIPYFVVLITFTILFSIMKMFGGGRRGGGLV